MSHWYPFCCLLAVYDNDGGVGFEGEPPVAIREINGDWVYESNDFTTSSEGATLSYACEVMGDPMIEFTIVGTLSDTGGIRVYLRANETFSAYICVDLTRLGGPGDEDRKCANIRFSTNTGVFFATSVNYQLFNDGANISVGLDTSREGDPRIVVAHGGGAGGTTISIADYLTGGLEGFGHYMGFGTIPSNSDEITFRNVTLKSFSGDCCGPMPGPLLCDEHNPCGGDGVGGNVQLHEGSIGGGGFAGVWQKVGDYWYAKSNSSGGHDLDWWTFNYGTGVVQAICTIPEDCGINTTRVTKSLSIYAWFRLVPTADDCSSGGSTSINIYMTGVANYEGAISGATVTMIESDCKGNALVQTETASATHVGDGVALDPGNSSSGCVDSESILCQASDQIVSGFSKPLFPLGFVLIKIDIDLNQGIFCGVGTPPVDKLFRVGGEFSINISINSSDIIPVEPCEE